MVNAQDKADVLAWTSHTGDSYDTMSGITEVFNAQSSTTRVQLVQVPGSETDATKLVTAVRGGTGPDVYMLDRFTVPERAANGLLQDLTDPLTAAGVDPNLATTYAEAAAAEATFQGKPYAIPFDADTRGLFVNLDLIKEAGEDPATFNLDAEPRTWDDLQAIFATLNKKNATGDIYERAGFIPWRSQGSLYSWGFMWGGDFFDEAACQVTPDDPKIVDALRWVTDYANEYGAKALDAAGTIAENAPPSDNPFIQGRIGAVFNGDWNIALLQKYGPDLNWDVIVPPVPTSGAPSVSWGGGESWVIPQGAKNVEGGLEFILYIAGEPGQRTYTQKTAHLPTYKALMDNADILDERHKTFADVLLPITVSRPPLPVGAKYWDELAAAFEKARLGQATPADALKAAKKNTQQLLDPFCPLSQAQLPVSGGFGGGR